MADQTREVTVTFDADEYDRLAAVAEEPESFVREAAMRQVTLSEAAASATGRRVADGDDSEQAETPGPAAPEGRPAAPVGVLVGFEPEHLGDGESTVTMEAGPRHANPMGTVHGGVICDLGDAAMGMAYASTLAEGESFTTLQLSVNFLRPVLEDRLEARGRVVNRGRTIGLVECDVTNSEDDLVARLQSTCMTLRGEQAAGR